MSRCSNVLLYRDLLSCPECQTVALAESLSMSVGDYDDARHYGRMACLGVRANEKGNHFHLLG